MSANGSMMADEDEEFMTGVIWIMIVWTLAVVAAGILLVLLRDPFAAIFGITALL